MKIKNHIRELRHFGIKTKLKYYLFNLRLFLEYGTFDRSKQAKIEKKRNVARIVLVTRGLIVSNRSLCDAVGSVDNALSEMEIAVMLVNQTGR